MPKVSQQAQSLRQAPQTPLTGSPGTPQHRGKARACSNGVNPLVCAKAAAAASSASVPPIHINGLLWPLHTTTKLSMSLPRSHPPQQQSLELDDPGSQNHHEGIALACAHGDQGFALAQVDLTGASPAYQQHWSALASSGHCTVIQGQTQCTDKHRLCLQAHLLEVLPDTIWAAWGRRVGPLVARRAPLWGASLRLLSAAALAVGRHAAASRHCLQGGENDVHTGRVSTGLGACLALLGEGSSGLLSAAALAVTRQAAVS